MPFYGVVFCFESSHPHFPHSSSHHASRTLQASIIPLSLFLPYSMTKPFQFPFYLFYKSNSFSLGCLPLTNAVIMLRAGQSSDAATAWALPQGSLLLMGQGWRPRKRKTPHLWPCRALEAHGTLQTCHALGQKAELLTKCCCHVPCSGMGGGVEILKVFPRAGTFARGRDLTSPKQRH